jgi:type II secretory pathway component PulF
VATFSYKTVTGAGGATTIEAPDRAAAIRELARRGQAPVWIEPVDGDRGIPAAERPTIGARWAGGTGADAARGRFTIELRAVMSRAEMAAFMRELATAVLAGLPLVQGLKTIARQGRTDRQKAMLAAIIHEVEHGRSLAEAASSWGKPFNDLTINMIRSGEVSGKLGEVLLQTADLLDRDVKLRRSILAATLYPMILAGLITIAVIVVVTVIVPSVVRSLAGQVAHLPMPTRIVMGVAEFFGSYWWLILPAVGGAFYGLGWVYAQPRTRLRIDERLLKLPLLGRLLRDVAVARFTRTLGTLTSAGIPILTALRVTKGTLNNRAMERVIDEVCEQVAGGRTIAEPMERSGYFPPMLVQIVNMGERSGKLDEMLTQAATAFEDRTETSVKLFTTALPPLLVVVLACVVGFVVLSILLPILQMQEAIR